MKFYRGEHLPIHPKFSANSEALCNGNSAGPAALDAPNLKYTEDDDRAIDDFHKQFSVYILLRPASRVHIFMLSQFKHRGIP